MTSGPDTQMGEREAFEEWFSIEKKHFCDGYGHSVIFNKCDNGAYACGLVDDVWEAWQARADQPMPGGDVVRARNMAYQLLQLRYGEKDHSAIVLLVDKIIEAYAQASPAPATEGAYKPTYVTTSTNPQVGDTEAQAFIEKRQRTGPVPEQPDEWMAEVLLILREHYEACIFNAETDEHGAGYAWGKRAARIKAVLDSAPVREISPLEKQNKIMRDVLEMLSKRAIATWYPNPGTLTGYYAGWDDAEYAIKKALAGENWKRNDSNVDSTEGK